MSTWNAWYDSDDTANNMTQEECRKAWTTVYPVMMRTILHDNAYKFTDTLVYIASSPENAKDWCERNTDVEAHDEKNWWWFVINQEAIDGEYSGIRGVVEMLDWNAKSIDLQPIDGYTKEEENKQESE